MWYARVALWPPIQIQDEAGMWEQDEVASSEVSSDGFETGRIGDRMYRMWHLLLATRRASVRLLQASFSLLASPLYHECGSHNGLVPGEACILQACQFDWP